MGYFDRTGLPPAIPAPAGVQLWDDGDAPLLTWRRPLGGCDGYVVLRGAGPATLAEVARLPASATRWPVPAAGGAWLAVACVRSGVVGAPGAPVVLGDGVGSPGASGDEVGAPGASGDEVGARGAALDTVASGRLPARLAADRGAAVSAQTTPREPAALPGSRCHCCAPPRPLAPDEGALSCPDTGELYAVLATGDLVRAAELPFGLCRCCEARQPLIRCGEEVVCLARPEQAYVRQGGAYAPRPAGEAPSLLADAEAIDAALRANSALLGVNGVFVSEGADRWRIRR